MYREGLWEKQKRLRQLGDYEGALQALDEYIKEFDTDDLNLSTPLNHKGGILLLLFRYEEALVCLEKSVSLFKEGANLNNLGLCYAYLKRPNEAINMFKESIEEGYNHEGVYFNLGNAHADLGELSTALDYWEYVVNINPLNRACILEIQALARSCLIKPIGTPKDLISQLRKEIKGYNGIKRRDKTGELIFYVSTPK